MQHDSQNDDLYVFGDNEARCGLGGQAGEMRGEPNAVGVATLRAPGFYWTDRDYDRQCAIIDADIAPILEAITAGRTVVLPTDGLGTGIAQLDLVAPKTFAYLTAKLVSLQ